MFLPPKNGVPKMIQTLDLSGLALPKSPKLPAAHLQPLDQAEAGGFRELYIILHFHMPWTSIGRCISQVIGGGEKWESCKHGPIGLRLTWNVSLFYPQALCAYFRGTVHPLSKEIQPHLHIPGRDLVWSPHLLSRPLHRFPSPFLFHPGTNWDVAIFFFYYVNLYSLKWCKNTAGELWGFEF